MTEPIRAQQRQHAVQIDGAAAVDVWNTAAAPATVTYATDATGAVDVADVAAAGAAAARPMDRPPRSRGRSLTIEGLCKSFAGRSVLRDVDLHIDAGEFIVIVGRSGCGKSTLLRLIAGLDDADRGTVRHGALAADAADSATGGNPEVRFMFQEPRLLPWKSVLENVALGLGRAGLAASASALAMVGLSERAQEWPAVLSGGQRQRVALARALVHDPHLLLLDEPLGALDALTRLDMQQRIEALWRQRGFTAILVTHDVQEAVALADRVLLVEDGRITLDQTINLPRPRLRSNPACAALEEHILQHILHKSDAVAP